MSSLPWKSVEEENAKAEDVAGLQDGDRQEGEKEAVLKEASQKGHDANVPRETGVQTLKEMESLWDSKSKEDAPKPTNL